MTGPRQHEQVSTVALWALLASVLLQVGGVAFAQDPGGAGLTGRAEIEKQEAETALAAALARIEQLEERLASAEKKSAVMAESLAAANAEAGDLRERYDEMRLKLEAMGPAVLSDDGRALDRRLLAAVNDLRLSEESRQRLVAQMVRLAEASFGYLAVSETVDPAARARLEQVLAETDALVGAPAGASPLSREAGGLEQLRVVTIEPELGLVVVGGGEAAGLRAGVPLRFYRDDVAVGSALVVDVRERVAGAIVTGGGAGPGAGVSVGDVARVDSMKPLTK